MGRSVLRFAGRSEVWLRTAALGSDLDCLTLFIGDRLKTLIEAHQEIARCFSSQSDPEEVARCLSRSPAVTSCYEIRRRQGDVSVLLRDDVYLRAAEVDDLEILLRVRDRRNSFLEATSVRRLGALGALLPTLRGTVGKGEATDILRSQLVGDEACWASDLLEKLHAKRILEETDALPNRMAHRGEPPRVSFLGHSSLLVQSPRSAVLVDPLLRFDLGLPRSAFDITRLDVGAIVCTHSHWDHCDPQTYLWFDKSTPVLVPRVRRPTALNPPIAPVFARLGFRDVRELDPWQRVTVNDVEIVAVPFHGEQDEPGEEFDHFTYVIRCEELTLYGGVDVYRDSFGDMTAALERVRDEFRPNLAFLPCSDVVYRYDQGGGSRFCRYYDRGRASRSFQYTAPPAEAARWAAILDAPIVVPYALFLFSRRATHPGIHALARALREGGLSDRFWPLRPLDRLSVRDLADRPGAHLRRMASRAWYGLAPYVGRR